MFSLDPLFDSFYLGTFGMSGEDDESGSKGVGSRLGRAQRKRGRSGRGLGEKGGRGGIEQEEEMQSGGDRKKKI